MSLANLVSDSDIQDEVDSLGGTSRTLESGVYAAKINVAYITKSKGEATGIVLHLTTVDDREIRQTLWATSGKAKGKKNYYEDKNGNKKYLPGFIHANALALLTVGKEISTLETEERVIKLWNKDAGGEIPTKVDMITDLVGKEIYVGLIKQTVDKTALSDSGEYAPTGETREENEIDKFFRAEDKMTTTEIRAQATEPAFFDAWSKKWTGVTKDRSTKVAAGSTAGAPKAAAAAKPTTSLFG